MFESYDELKELKDVANYLSRSSDWPQLYNEAQLARNEVPVYAATAMEDMYVDYGLACNTAAKVKNLKQVISNTWYHDAVETKAAEVMAALFALKEDRID
jgi:proline iminopeptidase